MTCPSCKAKRIIADEQIVEWIMKDEDLRKAVASALGRLTGGMTTLNAAQRSERARKAVQARFAKQNPQPAKRKPAPPPPPPKIRKPKKARKAKPGKRPAR